MLVLSNRLQHHVVAVRGVCQAALAHTRTQHNCATSMPVTTFSQNIYKHTARAQVIQHKATALHGPCHIHGLPCPIMRGTYMFVMQEVHQLLEQSAQSRTTAMSPMHSNRPSNVSCNPNAGCWLPAPCLQGTNKTKNRQPTTDVPPRLGMAANHDDDVQGPPRSGRTVKHVAIQLR
jgi:hypothetical protein